MLKIVGELVAAALTATALFIGHVKADPQPNTCVTEQMIVARMGGAQPSLNMKDEELVAFNDNFKQLIGGETPKEVDQVIVYGNLESTDEDAVVLFIPMSHNCIFSAGVIPLHEFLRVYRGNRA
jgi:hypothetical protein